MKKILLAVLMLLSVQVVYSQAKFTKDLSKSDEEIANPKKNTNPKTWINRGNLMQKIYDAPTAKVALYVEEAQLPILMKGEQQLSTKELDSPDGEKFRVIAYDDKEIFTMGGKIFMSRTTKTEINNPLDKALEAYKKAAALGADAKALKESFESLSKAYQSAGLAEYYMSNFDGAVKGFKGSLECSSQPSVGIVDTSIMYNIGLVATKIQDYKTAEEYYTMAANYGYVQNGDVYVSMYEAIRGQTDTVRAGTVLMDAYKKYPTSLNILATLVNHYLGVGEDPKIILPILHDAQKATTVPNASLYYVEGNLHMQLKDNENAVIAYTRAIAINPEFSNAYYAIGSLYYYAGSDIQTAANANDKMSAAEYDAEFEKASEQFKKSIAPFQKAFDLNPNEKAYADALRSVYYRFRTESDENMANYEKYKAICDKFAE